MSSSTNRLFPRAALPARVGEAVCAARLEAGLTQRELATAAGVSVRSLVRLERGDHRPSSRMVHAVERALGIEKLVPGWVEPADPEGPCYGPRARTARIAAGLTLGQVAAAAGVSAATLSRFERELGDAPSLAGPWGTPGEGVVNEGLARALGFANPAAMNEWCQARGGSTPNR